MQTGGGILVSSIVMLAKAAPTARRNAARPFDVAPLSISLPPLSIGDTSELTGAEAIYSLRAFEVGKLTCPLSALWGIQFWLSDSAVSGKLLQLNSVTDRWPPISVDANQIYALSAACGQWSRGRGGFCW
jgi:hypothetical protein